MGIAAAPLRDLVQTIFEHAGCAAEEARTVADHLVGNFLQPLRGRDWRKGGH